MSQVQTMLAEFVQEMGGTRKTLERIPESKFAWKPHIRSGNVLWLATHLTDIPSWATWTIKEDSIDMAPGGIPLPQPPQARSVSELLDRFDANVAEARQTLARARDEELGKPWSLMMNGQAMFTMPKGECLRTWVLNHNVHHRAQLGVYLRLNDIPVPALYGPSADESGM